MKSLSSKLLCLLFILISTLAYADTQNFQVGVGGTIIDIQAPDKFHEVTSIFPEYERFFKTITPQTNRLLGAMISEEDLQRAYANQEPMLNRYMMLQVSYQMENEPVSSADFQEITSTVKKSQKALFKKIKDQTADEVTDNVSEEYKIPVDIKIGEPVPLGTFVDQSDAYGFGNLMRYKVSSGEKEIEYDMVTGISFLKVKNRVLFAYVYSLYESEKDINWTKSKSIEWIDSILKLNRK
jgi:hypothetical protein